MELPLKILLAYLLGSIVGSLVVGRLRGGVDIRKSGSGNAGATNALRTQGAGVRDLGHPHRRRQGLDRGRRAAGPRAAGRHARVRQRQAMWLPAVCALRRHPRPRISGVAWLSRRQGRGHARRRVRRHRARAAAAAVRDLARRGHGVGFRRAGLDHRGVRHPRLSTDARRRRAVAGLGFALACAVLVVYTHRGNVRRMRAGTEPRARRLWLFGRGRT